MIRGLASLVARRIAIKLTLTLVAFVGLTSLAAGLYLEQSLEAFALTSLEARLGLAARLLHDEARTLVTSQARAADLHSFVVRAGDTIGARVSIIAPDGRVIADSSVPPAELAVVENHAGRPEVQTALRGRQGRDLRTSATVREPLFYVAMPITEGERVVGVLRVAFPLAIVTASYAALRRDLLIGGAVALAVALAIGIFVSRRITRPVVEMQAIARRMADGDFAARAPIKSTDELGALAGALNDMAGRLESKIEDLEHEQGKVKAILDGMVEGVIALDGRDEILWLNERARAMFRVDDQRGRGRRVLEVIRNTDLHAVVAEARESQADVPERRELRLGERDERIVEVNALPLRLPGGETGVVAVLHDVSELRRLEQVRTEFVANVSHELRTPLTAIQGYVETLLGGAIAEPDNAQRFLEIVLRHTERLGRLLGDLTDLSNIELGKLALRLAETKLAPIVESVLEITRPRAENGRVALEAHVPDALPPVYADHDRVAQILINLVDNAVKYTPPGGRVSVSAAVVAGPAVEVSVRDSGVGISSADLPRVTERFYRVDKARSRELGGTGLGLAIVKHLVAAHGGNLQLESELGRGTLVRFTLPVATRT